MNYKKKESELAKEIMMFWVIAHFQEQHYTHMYVINHQKREINKLLILQKLKLNYRIT